MWRTGRRGGRCLHCSSRLMKWSSGALMPSCARLGRARAPVPTRASPTLAILTLVPAKKMATILIIEDEAKMRRLLELNLGDDGFKTVSAGDAETGLKLLASEPVHLVLTDLKLPGMSGLEFLQTAKQENPALPIVVMTAFGS